MKVRIRVAAGLLLAATAFTTAVGTAPVAGAFPVSDAPAAQAEYGQKPPEGPYSANADCFKRAQYWTQKTGHYHFCRYKDGSDGYATGWWVWPYL